MVEEVDAEIGRVLQALEDAGQISGSGFFVIFETINRPEKNFNFLIFLFDFYYYQGNTTFVM